MLTRNWKLTYASYWSCQQRHIKYWSQLSNEQQNAAILKYADKQMDAHVYRVTVAGLIIDRRLVARDDDNGQIPTA